VADLITIVNEHMKFARESEAPRLLPLVLNECIAGLETYQTDVIKILKSQSASTLGLTFLCAVVNDAANLMEEVDKLVEETQEVADNVKMKLRNSIVFVNGGEEGVKMLGELIMVITLFFHFYLCLFDFLKTYLD
jgi:hypothetical protein